MDKLVTHTTQPDLAERLANGALALLVFVKLVFQASTVGDSFPVLAPVQPLVLGTYLVAAALLCVILMRRRRLGVWGVAGLCLMAGILFVSYAYSYDYTPLLGLVFLVAVCGMDPRRLCRSYLYGSLAALCTVVLVATLPCGVVEYHTPNGFLTSGYGFGHPNTFAVVLFGAFSALMLVADLRRRWLPLCLLGVCCSAFSFVVLSSRTGGLELAAEAAVLMMYGLWGERLDGLARGRWARVAVMVVPVALCVCFVACIRLYASGSGVLAAINDVISDRIGWAAHAYEHVGGFTALGRTSPRGAGAASGLVTDQTFLIDSAFAYYSLVYGLAAMACWVCVYMRAIRHMPLGDRPFVLWATVLLYGLYMVTEVAATRVEYNATLPFLAVGFASAWDLRRLRVQGPQDGRGARGYLAPWQQWLAMGVVAVCLGVASIQALQNGTGEQNAHASFAEPVRVEVAASQAGERPLYLDLRQNNDHMLLSWGGHRYRGVLRKASTRDGQTTYTMGQKKDEGHAGWSFTLSRPTGAATPEEGESWVFTLKYTVTDEAAGEGEAADKNETADEAEVATKSFAFALKKDGTCWYSVREDGAPVPYEHVGSYTLESNGTLVIE